MGQGLRLGRVAGIAVHVHWSVAATLVFIAASLGGSVLPAAVSHQPAGVYWAAAGAAALMFAASVLPHELAHAWVARRNGVQVRSITLSMLGGVAELGGEPPTAGAGLRIAVAGPAASLGVAALFAGAAAAIRYGAGPVVAAAAALWLAEMNGLLAVFNMLPGAPLDGGRVLRAALWRHCGDRARAELASARAGQVLGAAMITLGVAGLLAWGNPGGLWLMMAGVLLVTAAGNEAGAAAPSRPRTAGRRSVAAPTWHGVADGAGQGGRRPWRGVFPVLNADGALTGAVVADLHIPGPPDGEHGPRGPWLAPAGPLLTRPPLSGDTAAVVLQRDVLTGQVTARELRQAAPRPAGAPAAGAAAGPQPAAA